MKHNEVPAEAVESNGIVTVHGETYAWNWSKATDGFTVADADGRKVVQGDLQCAVKVLTGDGNMLCSPGTLIETSIDGGSILVRYGGVNGTAKLTVLWSFFEECFWIDSVKYRTHEVHDIVALSLFARGNGAEVQPRLAHTYLIQPGVCESSGLSPLLPTEVGLDLTTWLGRGSMGPDSQVYQQWGLPAHYFCGVTRDAPHSSEGSMRTHLSDAFCLGLADFPRADLMLHLAGGRVSPVFDYRSDLWHHVRAPGELELGAPMVFTFGKTYRDAIRNYYSTLLRSSRISVKNNSEAKNRVLTGSQFNTWGAQCGTGKVAELLDQELLLNIYDRMRSSGLRPDTFVVDCKWEGHYGLLEHSTERLPDFEGFLDRVRSDGCNVGLWAAFLRTDDPASLGLDWSHVMRDASNQPIAKEIWFERSPYYLLDITQPRVQEVVKGNIRRFVERYRPDLVKFDFGYELPSLSVAIPQETASSGEQLLRLALDVIAGALREANPDIVVMYYSLSPLLIGYLDQHCHDDLYLCVAEYDHESARRLTFSSLLGDLGMPTYSSGGYDWESMPQILFRSTVAGSVGTLASIFGDERGDPIPANVVAKYNGLNAITRRGNTFKAEPLDTMTLGSATGARSGSWARWEGDRLVSVALKADSGVRTRQATPDIGVTSDGDVVVSSMTGQGMADSNRLGLVPFGTGSLSVKRLTESEVVDVTTHFANGVLKSRAHTIEHALYVDFGPMVDGQHVEWVEVVFPAV